MTKSIKTKELNYGIALLKTWMCFEVILCHFDSKVTVRAYDILRLSKGLAVPCFMIISFYYMAKTDIGDCESVKMRLKRLLVPHIGWSLIYFLYYFVIAVITGGSIFKLVAKLILQIGFGHTLNTTMWFQVDLILITMIFIIIIRSKLPLQKISIVLGIVALLVQYSGLNYMVFSHFPFVVSYPLGRLAEVIPCSVIGYLAGNINLFQRIKEKKWNPFIWIIVIGGDSIFIRIPAGKGFGYNGIGVLMQAVCLCAAFFCIPDVFPDKFKNALKWVSFYTMGIYFIHKLVGEFLSVIFMEAFEKGIIMCAFVFSISLMICWAVSLIPNKVLKQMVM